MARPALFATSGVPPLSHAGTRHNHLSWYMVWGRQIRDESKQSHRTGNVDVAARYLVYNLFIAIGRMPETSRLLKDIDEKEETLARAVACGWIEVFERRRSTGAMVQLVALTDEGRRMAAGDLTSPLPSRSF